MSTTVDNRVVKMTFDNDQFEKNVSTSLDTLDKLKDSLKFKDTSQGLENLNKSIKNVDVSPIQNSLASVGNSFEALIAKATVITNVVNSLVNKGKELVKSIAIDPVTDGFSKYEAELKSVHTMMVATGADIETATEQMRKLSWYTDETSYSYSDMADNISKFTSQGIGLEDAVSYMQGIGNMAGYAGASVTSATHAMEGFSKAMGAGYMSRTNWHWIQTAQMDTVQVKETFLDAAVACGTLKKKSEGLWETLDGTTVTVANFAETLQKKWMTSGVMAAADAEMSSFSDLLNEFINSYNEAANEAGEETLDCSEAMDLLTDSEIKSTAKTAAYMEAMEACGKKIGSVEEAEKQLAEWVETNSEIGFRQAQMYRTFGDVVEATKEAVASTWREIFSLLLGNADQATELWSYVGSVMYGVFVTDLSEIKSSLIEWSNAGGFNMIFSKGKSSIVTNAIEKISRVLGTFKEVISNIFPKPSKTGLLELTAKMAAFLEVTTLSDEAVENLKIVLTNLLTPLGGVKKILSAVIEFVAKAAIAIETIAEYLLKLAADLPPLIDILDAIWSVLGNFINTDIIDSFLVTTIKLIAVLGRAILTLADSVFGIISSLTSVKDVPLKLSEAFEQLFGSERYVRITNALGGKVKTLLGEFSKLQPIADFFKGVINLISNKVQSFISLGSSFEKIGTALNSFKESVLDKITELLVTIGTIDIVGAVNGISSGFDGISKSLSSIFPIVNTGCEKLSAVATSMSYTATHYNACTKGMSALTHDLGAATNSGTKSMKAMATATEDAADTEDKLAKNTKTTGTVIKDYFSNNGVSGTIEAFSEKLVSAKNYLSEFLSKLTVGKAIALAFAGTTVVSSLKIGTGISNVLKSLAGFNDSAKKNLNGISSAISRLIKGVAGGLTNTFKSINSFLGSFKQKSTASIIKSVALAIGVLAASLFALSYVPYEDLLKATNVLVGLMAVMTGMTVVIGIIEKLNKSDGVSPKLAIGLVAFATAMLAIVGAFKLLEGATLDNCWQQVVIFAALCGALVAATVLVSKFAPQLTLSALSLVAFAVAMKSVIKNFLAIQGIESFGEVVTTFTDTIKSIGDKIRSIDVGKVIAKFGDNLAGIAAGAAAIFLAYKVFKLGGNVTTNILKIGLTLTALTAAMAILERVLERINKIEFIDLETSISALWAIAGAIALLQVSSALTGKNSLRFALGLTLLTTNMWSMLGMIKVLNYFTDSELERGLIVIGGLSLIIDAMMLCSHAAGGLTSFIGVIALLGTAMTGLVVLTLIENADLISAGVALGAVVAALAYALKESTKCTVKDTAKFIIVTAGFVTIAFALYEFATRLNGVDILTPTISLLATLGVMAAIFTLLGKYADVGTVAKGAASLAAGFAIVIASITAIVAAFGALSLIPGYSEFMDKGGEAFVQIGNIIGQFIGAIAGGMTTAYSATLIDVADNLCEFKNHISPFIDWCTSITEATILGVARFAGIVLMLTGADFVSAWGTVLSGGGIMAANTIDTFNVLSGIGKGNLGEFLYWMSTLTENHLTGAGYFCSIIMALSGASFVSSWSSLAGGSFLGGILTSATLSSLSSIRYTCGDFFDWLSDFTESDVAAANAFSGVIASISDLGQNYGKLKDFTNKKDILDDAATIISEFVKKISNVSDSDVSANERACTILERIAKASEEIGNEGGLLGGIVGENNLGTFSKGIKDFGEGISSYITDIANIADNAEDKNEIACKVLERVADASRSIANSGGWVGGIVGENDLEDFAPQLKTFATAIVDYATGVQDIPDGADVKSEMACSILESVATAASMIPNIGGFISKLTGDTDYTAFNTFITEVGTAIVDFVDDVNSKVTADDITAVRSNVDQLREMILSLNEVTEVGPVAFGMALDDIALAGITRFTSAFDNSAELVKEAVEGFLSEALSVFKSASTNANFYQKGYDLINIMLKGFNSIHSEIIEAGRSAVNGLIAGLTTGQTKVEEAGRQLAIKFKESFETQLDIESPSKVMEKDGNYVVQGFVNGIANKIRDIKLAAFDMSDAVEGTLRDALEIHSPSAILEWIGKMCGEGLVDGITEWLPNVSSIANKLGSLIPEEITNGITSKWSTVQNAIQLYAEDGTISLTDLANMIVNGDDDSQEQEVEEKVEDVSSAAKTTTKTFKELANTYDFASGVVYQFTQMYDAQIKKVNEYVNVVDVANYAVSNLAATLYEETYGTLNVAYATQEELTTIMSNIQSMFQETSDNISNTISSINVFDDFSYEENTPDIEKLLFNANQWDTVAREYANKMQMIFADDRISSSLLKYVSSLGIEEAIGWADMLLEADETQISELAAYYDDVAKLSEDAGDKVIASWAASLIGIDDIGTDYIYGQMSTNINQALATAIDPTSGNASVMALCENMIGTMESVLNLKTVYDIVDEVCKGLGTRFVELTPVVTPDVKNFTYSCVHEMIDTLSLNGTVKDNKVFKTSEDVGLNLLNGLLEGVNNPEKRSEVVNSIISLCKDMIAAAMETTQEASPSKVFKEIGYYLDLGLVKGIEVGTEEVVTATNGMANSALDSFGSVINRIADFVDGNFEYDPVIKPTLDLSNVEAGASTIGSLLQANRLSAELSATKQNQNEDTSGAKYQFVQNNYSPKALSRIDIYRQTKNQFAMMKEVTNAR